MSKKKPTTEEKGRYDYVGLDRAMHEKARLGVMTSLISHPSGLSFNELKELCALTDGNLSRHLQVLETEGLVKITKKFVKKRPQTMCILTAEGRKRFITYLHELEKIVSDAGKVAADEKGLNKMTGELRLGTTV